MHAVCGGLDFFACLHLWRCLHVSDVRLVEDLSVDCWKINFMLLNLTVTPVFAVRGLRGSSHCTKPVLYVHEVHETTVRATFGILVRSFERVSFQELRHELSAQFLRP